MMCAWKELLDILPSRIRNAVDRAGRETMQELRLRINGPPELIMDGESHWLKEKTTAEDLNYIVNLASRYSPWAASTISSGYLTAPGGHRIGLCGTAVYKDGQLSGIKNLSSLCIRVARDYPGIAQKISSLHGSILILGAPGWGKTTFLRDLIRQISEQESVCVVDERSEIFPEGIGQGKRVDVLRGCSKQDGIPMALRTMGPSVIAVDEITEEKDTAALLVASHCGVRLLATAHSSSIPEFFKNRICQLLVANGTFDYYISLKKDKSYKIERVTV